MCGPQRPVGQPDRRARRGGTAAAAVAAHAVSTIAHAMSFLPTTTTTLAYRRGTDASASRKVIDRPVDARQTALRLPPKILHTTKLFFTNNSRYLSLFSYIFVDIVNRRTGIIKWGDDNDVNINIKGRQGVSSGTRSVLL